MVDNRRTTAKILGSRSMHSFIVLCVILVYRSSSRDNDKYVNKTRIWHRVYEAMFYISTADRRPAFRGRLTIVSKIYIATYITARCKELQSRLCRRTSCVLTHWHLECMHMSRRRSCSVVSYLVSPSSELRVEPRENLIVASVWSRHSGWKNRYSNCSHWTKRWYKPKMLKAK